MSDEEAKTRITKLQAVAVPATGEACLVLIYPAGPEIGKRFVLDRSHLTVGRGADCDIPVDMESVSRRHARLFTRGSEWQIEDSGSTNGTYVNDRPVALSTLRDGDLIKIGKTIFKFLTGQNVEANYHEEIYRMTIVDGLTGVHNKRYFLEFLERELARCVRHQRPLSLVMFDIDHFKKINDQYGHLMGDLVLRELGARLLPRIRREELVARYGGEEFVAVLPETPHDGAMRFAEMLRQLVGSKPFDLETEQLTVTVSLGVATSDGAGVDITSFIRSVDEKLYEAKHAGRNCVRG